MTAKAFGFVMLMCGAGTISAATDPCPVGDGDPIRGTAGRQVLTIAYDATGRGSANLDCNGDGDLDDVGDHAGFTVYDADIQLKGNDSIAVTVAGAWSSVRRQLSIVLGPGKNSVAFNLGGAPLTNSAMIVDLIGGPGFDTVMLDAPNLDGAGLTLKGDLGLGNDSLTVLLPRMGNEAQFTLDVAMGGGTNAVTIGQGGRSLGSGSIQVNVEGGPGVDVVDLLLDGFWLSNAKGSFGFDLGVGNDRFGAVLQRNLPGEFSMLSGADVTIGARGGLGNDALRVSSVGSIVPAVGAPLALDLFGGAGNDTIAADVRLAASGLVHLGADGGAGADTMTVAVDTSPSAGTATHDLLVTGGDGNDVVTFNQTTAASSVFIGPSILDGSFGPLDTCVVGGANPPHKRNCER
jgi:hypothetical protein